ncbi:MAG TPA: peptidoglycan editing factor PgeF [Steroidobacteraceae bacterium]|nr:peptidoglycan editing factor PgeF [Steroidobacteraceae bacterium]
MNCLLHMRWTLPAGVRAAFTLRTGGVSAAPYDSFNVASHVGDDTDAVARNRATLSTAAALPREPAWLQQVHGCGVVDLDRTSWSPADPVQGDASVTARAGQVCAIQVADCLPVLLAQWDGARVGAAHAGWRGLAAGVLEATVAAMRAGSPAAGSTGGHAGLVAWLGPSISQPHFEVGDEVRAAFLAHSEAAGSAFLRNARGRWQCDLVALARQRLAAAGVTRIAGGGWCTYADREQFYSYRRDGQCGRMAALIWRA